MTNNNNNNFATTATTIDATTIDTTTTMATTSRGAAVTIADDDCILICHYTRDDMDHQRRHSRQLERALSEAKERDERMTNAYSALSAQFEAQCNELADERDHRQELEADTRRFGRMRDEARQAQEHERAAELARRTALEQTLAVMQLTVDQNRHMACPVCLELYVELGLNSECLLLFFCLFYFLNNI
jgi:hypothetical protein